MKRLHVVPEINEANGVYHVARLLAREDGGEVIDAKALKDLKSDVGAIDEVWVHGMWLPRIWSACMKVFALQTANHKPSLVRMTHGSLSPIYLERQGKWKKRLVGPIERWLFSKADRVVVTCEAEKAWCERWGLKGKIEVVDLKRFFGLERKSLRDTQDLAFSDLATTPTSSATPESQNAKVAPKGLRVLYLGRRHPLKGVGFLERAVQEINDEVRMTNDEWRKIEFRIVSDHFGEDLDRDWEWCDVLCLPTLSENFGLVVAEALERGKRVVVTDGAPAWEPPPEAAEVERRGGRWWDRLSYVRGFKDGTDEERVKLLKVALEKISLV